MDSINLQNLDDEQITILEHFLNEKDTKYHNEFFNSYAIDSVNDKYLANKIAISLDTIPVFLLYDVLISNISFTKHWIEKIEMKVSYKFFLNKAVKEEKDKRFFNYLNKTVNKDTQIIDKRIKI